MSSANPSRQLAKYCFGILLFGIALFLFASVRQIDHDLKRSTDWQTYFTKDSMHYYSIAQGFAAGDFSMAYEKRWPYRQPLFPLLVAGVMKLNSALFTIRLVNVGVIVVTAVTLYLILGSLWSDPFAAAAVSALFILCPAVYDQSIHGLTTEPLHLFLLTCAIACFLRYLKSCHWSYLWLLAFAIGLDHLDRINGLFLAIAAFGVLFFFELFRYVPKSDSTSGRKTAKLASRRFASPRWLHYAVAILILVLITAPSWLSRWHYFGNPFNYGAIQNFLWGDTYLGSMDAPRILTAGDYFASHSLLDAAGRFLLGCWKVFFVIPIDQERLPVLYFAALGGVWVAWRQKQTAYLWLLLLYLVQMLPLAWTQPVNTTPRIPYAATQPFELFFAGLLVHRLWLGKAELGAQVPTPDLANRLR
jgi:hypothetical protein